jgi:SGNH hydrolase-like domain, acetyltransferase AlgX
MLEITLRISHYLNPTFIFYTNSYNRYRGKPYAQDYNFKLNSLGFKDKEFTEKKENTYRIIGIGDSFAFGVVPYEYNYLTLLESHLKSAGYNIEVLNMGIGAMGPKEYLSLFVSEGLKLKPDMLLLSFFVGNDFFDCLNSERKWHSYSYTTSFIYYLITIWYKYEGVVVNSSRDYCDDCPTFDKKTYLEIEGERSFIFIEGNKLFVKSLNSALYYLSSINDICKKEHIKFMVVIIPDELQMDRVLQKEVIDIYYPKLNRSEWNITLPNTMLSDRLTKLGIKSIDLYSSFSTKPAERFYRVRDTHWNIAGNQLAAKIIKEHIISSFKENPKYRFSHVGQ